MRNLLVFGVLFVLIVASFLHWGDWFSSFFEDNGAVTILTSYGRWAWVVGLVLLMADLFLPLPATLVMSALGYIYGPFIGSIFSTIGSVMAGLLAFGLCRALGERGALVILGKKDLEKGRNLFSNKGGWIVAVSRWLPVLPEIVSCMAGLNQMSAGKFTVALVCGSLPLGLVFAYIGHSGRDYPMAATLISALFPVVLWGFAQWALRSLFDRRP